MHKRRGTGRVWCTVGLYLVLKIEIIIIIITIIIIIVVVVILIVQLKFHRIYQQNPSVHSGSLEVPTEVAV